MKCLRFRAEFGYAKQAFDKQDWNKAKTHFVKAREIDPSKIEAQLGLAETLRNLNEKEEAARILNDLIDQAGDIAYAYLMLGQLLGDEEKLKKAVELDPKNPDGWHEMGRILLKNKKEADALAAFRRAAELDPALAPMQFEAVKIAVKSKKTI